MSFLSSKRPVFVFFVLIMGFLSGCEKDNEVEPTGPIILGDTRYRDFVFVETIATPDVVYGQNTSQGGRQIDLRMNIYEPANDSLDTRPLVILAHGGGFTDGAREDFDRWAREFAHAGYVAATISYRIMDAAEPNLKIAVIQAVHDMKAAVRFFTKDEQYKVNPNQVFVGGFSAGAVMALHAAYIDQKDLPLLPPEITEYMAENDGISGNSGNPGASDAIKGVINVSGGLFKANFVQAGEPILYSAHGTKDKEVYCTIDPQAANNPGGDFTEGACLIHPIAEAAGIVNRFNSIEGGDHGAFFACEDCEEKVRLFLYENL
ncbi:MAG: alpha/beta hydrolase [Bacteroidota bacterium]